MLRLKTFGGLWLEGNAGPLTGAAAQRRRLVLLAALAAAGQKGMSRVGKKGAKVVTTTTRSIPKT